MIVPRLSHLTWLSSSQGTDSKSTNQPRSVDLKICQRGFQFGNRGKRIQCFCGFGGLSLLPLKGRRWRRKRLMRNALRAWVFRPLRGHGRGAAPAPRRSPRTCPRFRFRPLRHHPATRARHPRLRRGASLPWRPSGALGPCAAPRTCPRRARFPIGWCLGGWRVGCAVPGVFAAAGWLPGPGGG